MAAGRAAEAGENHDARRSCGGDGRQTPCDTTGDRRFPRQRRAGAARIDDACGSPAVSSSNAASGAPRRT